MVWFALHNNVEGYEYAPAQIQVQDVVVEGADEVIPTKFLKPVDSTPNEADEAAYYVDASGQGIPLIDFASLLGGDEESLSNAQAKEIERACREWGVFQVVNHGVSSEVIQRMSDLALEYFRRPKEEREMDMGIAPQPSSGHRDWIDSMIHLVKPYRPDVVKRRTLPQGYKETMDVYCEQVSKVSDTVRKVLSLGLGLKSSRIDEVMGEAGSVMAVNYYPPCPRPDLVTGLTAHSDVNVLSVLHQNEVEGLQVRKDGRWIIVPPTPGTLTINISDVLQVMSNEAYVSVEHRVFVNPHSARLSLAVFIGMSGDRYFGPLPELVDAEHPALYTHTTLSQYLEVVKNVGLRGKGNLATLRLAAAADEKVAVPELTTEPAAAFKFPEPSRMFVEPSNATGNVYIPQPISLGA